MASWRIEFSSEAHEQYKRLPESYRCNVDRVFKRLVQRGVIGMKPVRGEVGVYRLRIGRNRVLFKVIPEDKIYLVFRISTRGGAYK